MYILYSLLNVRAYAHICISYGLCQGKGTNQICKRGPNASAPAAMHAHTYRPSCMHTYSPSCMHTRIVHHACTHVSSIMHAHTYRSSCMHTRIVHHACTCATQHFRGGIKMRLLQRTDTQGEGGRTVPSPPISQLTACVCCRCKWCDTSVCSSTSVLGRGAVTKPIITQAREA
jgi:hypothetical protein